MSVQTRSMSIASIIGMAALFGAVLAGALCSPAALWAEETAEDPAAVEARIVKEIEALIDATGEISAAAHERELELIRKGVKAHEKGSFDRALELYDQALEVVPTSATAYYEKAFTYAAKGELQRAFDAATRSVLLNPKHEMGHIFKATLLDDMGYGDRAIAAYLALLEINPNSYLGQLNLGISLLRADRYEECRSALEEARRIQPEHPAVYLHLANLARVEGQGYEEQRYLEAFIERGAADPRLPAVKERLGQLRKQEITITPDSPFMAVELIEKGARALWKAEKHRQTFPDAKGYFPSYEEEHDVIATMLIPAWRDFKEENPGAEQGHYDLLLAIDDAGFIDEYIWYVNQNTFGEPAQAWLAEHQDRVDAFLAWAAEAGYLDTGEADEEEEQEAVDLPALVMEMAERSTLHYVIDILSEGAAEACLERESRRYRRHLELDGGDRVTRKQARETLAQPRAAISIVPLAGVLRTYLPDEEEWRQATGLFQSLGARYHDLAPTRPLPVSIDRSGDTISVEVDPENPLWMIYAMAKATFRYEPELRRRYGIPEDDRPTLTEEAFAWLATIQAYQNTLANTGEEAEAADGEEPQPDPYLDMVTEIAAANSMTGFVLFEMVHKTYGVPLERLDKDQADSLLSYLSQHVLEPVTAGGGGE